MSQMMNMSGFTKAVVGMIVGALVLMVGLQIYPMIVDVGNDINLMTKPGATSVLEYNGKRFDRAAIKVSTHDGPEDYASSAWLKVANTSVGFDFPSGTTLTTAADTVILPNGTEITETAAGAADEHFVQSNVKQASPVKFLQKNTALIGIVIQAIALLLSLAPMGMLGGVGYMFLGKFATGMSTISRVIVATIGVVIGGTVLVTFVGFIDVAYAAIDGNRFTVFGSGLGTLATTITDFWGVLFAIGIIVLAGVFGFQGIKSYRGRQGGDSALSA